MYGIYINNSLSNDFYYADIAYTFLDVQRYDASKTIFNSISNPLAPSVGANQYREYQVELKKDVQIAKNLNALNKSTK